MGPSLRMGYGAPLASIQSGIPDIGPMPPPPAEAARPMAAKEAGMPEAIGEDLWETVSPVVRQILPGATKERVSGTMQASLPFVLDDHPANDTLFAIDVNTNIDEK
eukprot:scaffold112839_cov47-Prasinocladus_malaysianus.AAC.1